MFRSTRCGLLASLLLVTGCFSAGSGGCEIFPPNGLTGNGTFRYECVGEGDPECDGRDLFTVGGQLPQRPVARGAEMRLTFQGGDRAVRPVSSAVVTTSFGEGGPRFVVERAGTLGFFVEARSSGGAVAADPAIEDAVRIRVSEPDRLGIEARPSGTLAGAFPVGVPIPLRATASAGGQVLAGALHVTWTADDPSVADVEPVAGSPGTCTVTGRKPGLVRVRAATPSLSAELVVEISSLLSATDAGKDSASDATNNDADAQVNDASSD